MPEFLHESHRSLTTFAAAFQAGVAKHAAQTGLIFYHVLLLRAFGVLCGQSLQTRSQSEAFANDFKIFKTSSIIDE